MFSEARSRHRPAATTATTILAGGLSLWLAPAGHRRTFYAPLTMKRFVATYFWEEARYYEDTENNPVVEQTAIRALLPRVLNEHYLPMEPLRRLYSEHWQAWQVEKPFWLTPKLEKNIRALFGDVIDTATREGAETDGKEEDGRSQP